MRYRLRTLLIVLAITLIPYVGSFLAFRSTPHRFDLAHGSEHYLVIFSMNTDLHCVARKFYWPLIATMPGHRHYPTREQHEALMQAKHRFPVGE